MTPLAQVIGDVFSDGSALMVSVLVFLAAAVLALGLMLGLRARNAVRWRAAGIAAHSRDAAQERSLQRSTSKPFSACSITPPNITRGPTRIRAT
jgi:hypothetical protein